jgi:hypothetical protein
MPDPAPAHYGDAKLNDRGYTCCSKPVGCSMTHEGCAYLQHPWKREHVWPYVDKEQAEEAPDAA